MNYNGHIIVGGLTMNNSTKAKYELAEKMLKGHIDIDEVVLMSGLSKDEVTKLADGLEINNPEVQRLKDLDTVDLNIGEILFDNLPAEDTDSEGI